MEWVCEMKNDNGFPEADKAGRILPLSIVGGVLSAALWICLICVVYLCLPRSRTIFVGFGTGIGPLTAFVIDYAGLVLPLLGIAAGASVVAMQSRRVYAFVLFWLPLILLVGLVLTVGPSLLKLLNDLA